MRRLGVLLAGVALAGCSMEPHYARPEAPVPLSWPVGDAYLRDSEAALPTITYKDVFHDARLQQLIGQALANNRDLRIAVANIEIARAQYHIQRAALLPEIDAGASAESVKSLGTPSATVFTANVSSTAFELDLFGRVRSLTHAAQDKFFATEAAARETRLTLVGNIATAWLNYASDASLLKIASDTVDSATRSVDLTRKRLNGGIAPRTDLRQAEQVLDTAQADVASSKTALAQDINALQLLVGAPIDPGLLPASIDQVESSILPLPAGLDSTILLRRPDVVQAEYSLRAANADIGAARAALFPRITLTGLAGFASGALGSLFKGGSFVWTAAVDGSYPIFRAGAGLAAVAQSRAQYDSAKANFEKSVQTAYREVADALARRGTIDVQQKANQANVDAAADTYKLADARYRGGIDTYLAMLDAQRSLYTAQRALVATKLTLATNLATLYQVIGGDALLDTAPSGPKALSPGDAVEPPAAH